MRRARRRHSRIAAAGCPTRRDAAVRTDRALRPGLPHAGAAQSRARTASGVAHRGRGTAGVVGVRPRGPHAGGSGPHTARTGRAAGCCRVTISTRTRGACRTAHSSRRATARTARATACTARALCHRGGKRHHCQNERERKSRHSAGHPMFLTCRAPTRRPTLNVSAVGVGLRNRSGIHADVAAGLCLPVRLAKPRIGNPGSHQHIHRCGARRQQCSRAGTAGGAGGHYVVDQHDTPPGDRPPA